MLFYEDIEKFYLVFQFTFFVESDDHFDLLDELAAEPNYISYPLKKFLATPLSVSTDVL